MKKKILVVDDHVVARMGLKVLLKDMYPYIQVYDTGNEEGCLNLLKSQKFDLIVMDLQMPNTDTLSLIELISIKYPKIAILVFSMLPEEIYGQRTFRSGAAGYLSKDAPIEEVEKAFDITLQNKRYMSQHFVELLANQIQSKHTGNPFQSLSHREFQIVHLLIKGRSVTSISESLNIRPSTVGTYKTRIFTKTNVDNLFELNQLAMIYGIGGVHEIQHAAMYK